MQQSARPVPTLRVAAAQGCSVPGDLAANAAAAARLVREAAAAGARLVVLPELFLPGYEPALVAADPQHLALDAAAPLADPRLEPLVRACAATATTAVVGAAVREGATVLLSALVVSAGGELLTRYDKQHLHPGEEAVFTPGTAPGTFELDGWRLGLGICADSGVAAHARAAAVRGAHAYLVGGLFGVGGGEREVRDRFPARARDNGVYALLSNHAGPAGEWTGCGGSGVWDPRGRPVVRAGRDEGVVVAELHPAELHPGG
ncbi:putative amidohydrolase [Kineococcus xinjiangensis]|uniref:Putative amidohydrolase n=1 Tax=Kineococcus xinjiangensis TaxID=512762 RepID=A0A2S6IFX9_9ACTN|nr:carbon-nitrogen hydrolase family protein [Kineococcus xinjiangensis]PPK93124.1 putative amidohydrolase [Kineococcus xinjiangensis]